MFGMKPLNLSIDTLTVEIRVMSINQKKMTLSVFNQIIIEPLFNKNGEQRGDHFGYINKDGYWVIWKKGIELRKTKIERVNSILSNRGTYVRALANKFKEINSKIVDSFDFFNYADRYDWDEIENKVADNQLSISNTFTQKYNSFYDELVEGDNQLFISI